VSPRRVLHILGTAELTTLALLLLNLVTVHHREVSGILGPVHGLAYTATIITAMLVANGRSQVWLRALVPGIGGLLAARCARCSNAPSADHRADLGGRGASRSGGRGSAGL
jgi:hypothetical protein